MEYEFRLDDGKLTEIGKIETVAGRPSWLQQDVSIVIPLTVNGITNLWK